MGLAALGAGAALALGGATAIGATAAAIGAGTFAALSVGTVFTTIATVGAVIGAVGVVTGVKELQTAGMVIGGIGGIGSLANAVGAFGANATLGSVFGGEAGIPDGAAGASLMNGAVDAEGTPLSSYTAASSGGDVIGTANNIAGVGAGGLDAEGNPLSSVMSSQAASPAATGASAVGTDAEGNPLSSVTKAPSSSASSATDAEGNPLSSTGSGTSTPTLSNSIPTIDKTAISQQFGTDPSQITNYKAPSGASYTFTPGSGWAPASAGGIGGFLGSQSGGLIGMGVIQAAGSFLQGAFDPLKPAQVAAYQAQANANNASAALTNKQVGNMGQPIPVAQRLAVTGKLGMMNSTPQGAAA